MDSPLELEGYAAEVHFSFGRQVAQREYRDLVARLLEGVSQRCLESGGKLIGHVKCFAEASDGNHFFGSVTSPGKGATCESLRQEPTAAATCPAYVSSYYEPAHSVSLLLALNVLIYGIPWSVTDKVLVQVLRDLAGDGSFSFEIRHPSHSC